MSKLRDIIKSVRDITVELVSVPEWGITIEMRTMKAIDRAVLLKRVMDSEGNLDTLKFQAGLIIASAFDPETGEKVFSDEDYDLLMQKSAGVIERLSNIAMKISGLMKQSLETAEKNS